jgi:hypothetical protein
MIFNLKNSDCRICVSCRTSLLVQHIAAAKADWLKPAAGDLNLGMEN